MIWLPYPPTTNHLFASVGGRRVKSKAYAAWLKEAGLALTQQKPLLPITEPYRLKIVLVRPDRRKRDLSNCIKAIEDLLVAHEITPDDSLCQGLDVSWEDSVDGPEIEVRAT